jgi:uncharacterized membrane protein YfcA
MELSFSGLTSAEHWGPWLYLGCVVFVAGIVRGLTGFGFSALCFFALAPVLSPLAIVPLMFALESAASLHLLRRVWGDVPRRWLAFLLVGSAIGIPVGVWLLSYWSADQVRSITGVVVLVACLLLLSGVQLFRKPNDFILASVGLLAGIANGMASIGGLVVAVYSLSARLALVQMRAGLIVFFLVIDVYGLLWFSGHGLLSVELLYLFAFSLPLMMLGNRFGFSFFDKTSENFKRYLAIGLLMALAVMAIFT